MIAMMKIDETKIKIHQERIMSVLQQLATYYYTII
jgi:hypothetical protein